MLLDPGLLLVLSLFGGWVTLDGTSFGQFMISRPLVAATCAGWLAGDPLQGAVVGVVLEAFQLGVLPVGAARYPEAGPAAVVAGAGFALAPPTGESLLVAVAFALVWESLAGETVRRLRQANIGLASVAGRTTVTPREIQRRHLLAIVLDYGRGALLVSTGLVFLLALKTLIPGATLGGVHVDERVVRHAMAALLASSIALFTGRRRLFVVGVAGGLIVQLVAR